jgi:hypothetical protein
MVSPRGGYARESEGCYAILLIELPTRRRIKLEQQAMQQNQGDGTPAQTRSRVSAAIGSIRFQQKMLGPGRNFIPVPTPENEWRTKQKRPGGQGR